MLCQICQGGIILSTRLNKIYIANRRDHWNVFLFRNSQAVGINHQVVVLTESGTPSACFSSSDSSSRPHWGSWGRCFCMGRFCKLVKTVRSEKAAVLLLYLDHYQLSHVSVLQIQKVFKQSSQATVMTQKVGAKSV